VRPAVPPPAQMQPSSLPRKGMLESCPRVTAGAARGGMAGTQWPGACTAAGLACQWAYGLWRRYTYRVWVGLTLCIVQGQAAPSGARMVGVLAALALALLGASLAQKRGAAGAAGARRRPPAAAKQAAALCGLQVGR
jgi:hypothetical protein